MCTSLDDCAFGFAASEPAEKLPSIPLGMVASLLFVLFGTQLEASTGASHGQHGSSRLRVSRMVSRVRAVCYIYISYLILSAVVNYILNITESVSV